MSSSCAAASKTMNPAHERAERLHSFGGSTVWEEFTPLAVKHKACNLGQGAPDFGTELFVREAAAEVMMEQTDHQYTRSQGHPRLVKQLAETYSPWLERDVDPMSEIIVSCGATQTLFSIMEAFVNPGDEVILLEPFFDIYPAQVTMAGGICKYVPMRARGPEDGEKGTAGDFYLDMEEMRAALTEKTRLIILNTPHNPYGKMFTLAELQELADLVLEHPRVLVVNDEVYEHLYYNQKHARLASLPGMFERSITVCSSGKTFNTTGWKIGWAISCAPIIQAIQLAHQWIIFSTPTPLQAAVARVLEKASEPYQGHDTYFDYLRGVYEAKKDHLLETLRLAGLNPIEPEGGFFIIANTSHIIIPKKYLEPNEFDEGKAPPRDKAFCRYMTVEFGVTAIPPSSFYSEEHRHLAANYARFACCKRDEDLHEARRRLVGMKDAQEALRQQQQS